MVRSITQDRAIQLWLDATNGNCGKPFYARDRSSDPIQYRNLTDSPAAFRYTFADDRIPYIPPSDSTFPGLSMALAVWVKQHSDAAVLPVPIYSFHSTRFRGPYHPGYWKQNRASTINDDDLRHDREQLFRDEALHRPLATIREMWWELVNAENVKSSPKHALKHNADDLSWDELLAMGMAYWMDQHPYAMILPMPVKGTDANNYSYYHPQSWVINADSPLLDCKYYNLYRKTPPEHISLMDNPLQLMREPSDHNAPTDHDPFAEFR